MLRPAAGDTRATAHGANHRAGPRRAPAARALRAGRPRLLRRVRVGIPRTPCGSPALRAGPRRRPSRPADGAVPVDDDRSGDDDPQRARRRRARALRVARVRALARPPDHAAPLLFAGDGTRGTLLGHLDPDDVFPHQSVYAGLAATGVRSTVGLPAAIARAAPNVTMLRGTQIVPFTTVETGLAAAAAAVAEGAGMRTSTWTRSTR